ncbi:MAG TPA: glycosyltransferase family 2 protein [Clostridia bacterium]|nr:glycosyltransferase family 2 protein [Clostridia bacterium]
MNILYNMVINFWILLNIATTTYCLYHISLAIAGFRKKKPFSGELKNHRFAAIIAARNEESVIGSLIESIRLQNYPKELIDIIVVADNCDDKTAEIAQKCGAIVYKRFNKAEVGKGFVLKFVFSKIFEERDVYDAFCIIDADNIVDRNFFLHMNQAICEGYRVAQGYRDMKNPADTWISGGHSLFYWMENRFFNHSRSILGLSATINGTGFMVATDLIKEIGFQTYTMTEDIEFTIHCVLHGYKVGYVPEARVYDEQPITFAQSMRQRIRWTNGLMQCFMRYTGVFAKRLWQKFDWPILDMLMYLFAVPTMVIGAVASVIYAILAAVRIFDPMGVFVNSLLLLVGSVAAFWLVGWLTVTLEKKDVKKMAWSVIAYPVFNLLWILIYAICIFKKKIDWKPITHVRNISIHEMESSKTIK